MLASVRYRLPGETLVHEIGTKHPPKRCTSLAEIPPQKGYLFAPFQENDAHPLWFFPADEHRTWTQPTEVPSFSLAYEVEEDHRTEYMRAFKACQAAFQQSELQKVVLSRTLLFILTKTLLQTIIIACSNKPASPILIALSA